MTSSQRPDVTEGRVDRRHSAHRLHVLFRPIIRCNCKDLWAGWVRSPQPVDNRDRPLAFPTPVRTFLSGQTPLRNRKGITMASFSKRCERCSSDFIARRNNARFCGEACRKAAARARDKSAPPPFTRQDVIETLDCALELVSGDLDELLLRYPDEEIGVDPVMDELMAGMDAHLLDLARIRAWVETVAS